MTPIIKSPCDEAVIRAACRAQPCQKDVRPWLLAATILGSSMAMIDGSAINVALPVMQSRLNATATQVQWIVESYALFLAALILVGGSQLRSLRKAPRFYRWNCFIHAGFCRLWTCLQRQSNDSGAIASRHWWCFTRTRKFSNYQCLF